MILKIFWQIINQWPTESTVYGNREVQTTLEVVFIFKALTSQAVQWARLTLSKWLTAVHHWDTRTGQKFQFSRPDISILEVRQAQAKKKKNCAPTYHNVVIFSEWTSGTIRVLLTTQTAVIMLS